MTLDPLSLKGLLSRTVSQNYVPNSIRNVSRSRLYGPRIKEYDCYILVSRSTIAILACQGVRLLCSSVTGRCRVKTNDANARGELKVDKREVWQTFNGTRSVRVPKLNVRDQDEQKDTIINTIIDTMTMDAGGAWRGNIEGGENRYNHRAMWIKIDTNTEPCVPIGITEEPCVAEANNRPWRKQIYNGTKEVQKAEKERVTYSHGATVE